MRELTLVLPHFQNLGMFAEQQKIWASYPDALRAQLHVILVDDCSPRGQRPDASAVTVTGLASLRIYRLIEKRRWNWLACRNLGAQVASTEWLLLTDIDHALPVQTLERIVDGPLDAVSAFRLSRVDAPRPWPYRLDECMAYKPHNDTFLMSRELFFNPGVDGYDERLSGLYGTSGEFRDRVNATARAVVFLPHPIIRYPREIIADASTHPSVYTRKNDPENDADLAQRKADRAKIGGWRPLRGLIAHELVYTEGRV